MLSETQKRLIEQASVTVWIRAREARSAGVLVGGQLILTAAHNVISAIEERSSLPLAEALIGLSMGDHLVVDIETAQGLLHVAPPGHRARGRHQPCWGHSMIRCSGTRPRRGRPGARRSAPVPLCYEQFPFMSPDPRGGLYPPRDVVRGDGTAGRADIAWLLDHHARRHRSWDVRQSHCHRPGDACRDCVAGGGHRVTCA